MIVFNFANERADVAPHMILNLSPNYFRDSDFCSLLTEKEANCSGLWLLQINLRLTLVSKTTIMG